MKLKYLYLTLSVLGICYTWYYNIQYFQTVEDANLVGFFQDAQQNFAGKSFGADLTVVLLTFFAFIIIDTKKIKVKLWWLLIPLSFLIAIAFTFPLYLYMRENALEKQKEQ